MSESKGEGVGDRGGLGNRAANPLGGGLEEGREEGRRKRVGAAGIDRARRWLLDEGVRGVWVSVWLVRGLR